MVSHIGFADPAVVEIIAKAGFDGAFIDMEHSIFDMQTVGEMIRVADLCDITPVVRVPDDNPKTILRLLDMGAQGIQIPHIAGVEGAKRAVEAVRYPPQGERGGAGSTPQDHQRDETAVGLGVGVETPHDGGEAASAQSMDGWADET